MKYFPSDRQYVGLFIFDGTETIDQCKAAIFAAREELIPGLPRNTRFLDVKSPKTGSCKRTTFKAPRAGDDEPKHDKRTAAAIALCESVGVEFWALGRFTRSIWGVRNGVYVEVWENGRITEVDAAGNPIARAMAA